MICEQLPQTVEERFKMDMANKGMRVDELGAQNLVEWLSIRAEVLKSFKKQERKTMELATSELTNLDQKESEGFAPSENSIDIDMENLIFVTSKISIQWINVLCAMEIHTQSICAKCFKRCL